MKRLRTWILVAAVAVVIGVVCYAARGLLLPPVASWLDVGAAPARVDYVFPLPGNEEIRPYVAAALVRLGVADHALIINTVPSPDYQDGIRPATVEVHQRVLLHRGVPDDRISILDFQSGSTADEVGALSQFLAEKPDVTVGVVTSAFHTRRTRWTLDRRLGRDTNRVTLVSAPNPGFTPEDWWKTEGGFLAVSSEYFKLTYYWLRYGNAPYWLAGIAIIAVGAVVWRVKRRVDG
jgi:uncharacterized SAM-binding protein YcdF (DUF218 family)